MLLCRLVCVILSLQAKFLVLAAVVVERGLHYLNYAVDAKLGAVLRCQQLIYVVQIILGQVLKLCYDFALAS